MDYKSYTEQLEAALAAYHGTQQELVDANQLVFYAEKAQKTAQDRRDAAFAAVNAAYAKRAEAFDKKVEE